jgi:hypothetical protein
MGATVSGLTELREDFHKAADEIVADTRKVVAKGLLNIKKETKARWSGLAHAPSLPGAVTYETTTSGSGASGEVGPDKARRQGALGNLVEYGSVNNAPIPALNPALDAEEPAFAKALEDLGGDLIEGKAVRSDGAPVSG